MLRFSQPAPKPATFDADVQPLRDAIKAIDAKGNDPCSKDFQDAWKNYKAVLAEHQHEKCAFCEAKVTPVAAGDVEHYAPKTEVGALSNDPTTWGEEEPFSNRVRKKREVAIVSERGYWWLAYEWNNYLFACESCNQKWKRTLFPVAEHPRACPPLASVEETPLLLNPYHNIDPAEHLRFNDFGAVESVVGSSHGPATIRTCFLDRGSLMRARAADASNATMLSRAMVAAQRELRSASGDVARVKLALALDQLLRLGDERRPFAGMVRIIAREVTRCTWEQLVALPAAL